MEKKIFHSFSLVQRRHLVTFVKVDTESNVVVIIIIVATGQGVFVQSQIFLSVECFFVVVLFCLFFCPKFLCFSDQVTVQSLRVGW